MNDQNASVHAHNRGKAKGSAEERARIATRDLPEGESIDAAFADALRRAADIFVRAGMATGYGEAWESGGLAGASKFNAHAWAARRLRSWADGAHGYTPGPRQASPFPPRGEQSRAGEPISGCTRCYVDESTWMMLDVSHTCRAPGCTELPRHVVALERDGKLDITTMCAVHAKKWRRIASGEEGYDHDDACTKPPPGLRQASPVPPRGEGE